MPSGYKVATAAYYSPGLCPSGYAPVSSGTGTIAELTETTHVCCPTAYDFTTQPTERPSDLNPFMSSIICQSEWNTATSETVTVTQTTLGGTTSRSVLVPTGGWLRAYGVVVKFREGDFDSKTTPSGTSLTTTNGPSSTPTTSASAESGSSSSGLSTGASIGVGVGVGIIGLALIVGGVWFLLKLRRKKQTDALPYAHHELPVWKEPQQVLPQELPSSIKYAREPVRHVPPQELEARY
ncbi:hypothetical protein K458DRAFT_421912 [Lentithecium fluviatile CBS 122367]|uniref:Mid2 domain-containing protein n=1 Tax=Lentithecium fluviatile CBS 122367 TaxID=1168545 RepID=A0A6G1IPC8_9PLEO|nr:hypothetical protein K458DRAFT_421912 [Lentithecium fluviatile CBS 122367]